MSLKTGPRCVARAIAPESIIIFGTNYLLCPPVTSDDASVPTLALLIVNYLVSTALYYFSRFPPRPLQTNSLSSFSNAVKPSGR